MSFKGNVLGEKDVNTGEGERRLSGEKRKQPDTVSAAPVEGQAEKKKVKRIFIPHQSTEPGHFHVVLGEDLSPRYKILDLMGEGTFAKCCELWDRQTKQYLACKIVRAIRKYTRDAEFELQMLLRLKKADPNDERPFVKPIGSFLFHPNAPHSTPEHMCILFPRMGPSLLDWIVFHGTFPVHGVAKIAYQVARTLDFLHTNMRLIHTDLKPENILFEEWDEQERASRRLERTQPREPKSWRIRVIDFGGATDEFHSPQTVVSTRHYRAPEVILGTGWMYAADIWSVGCILTELFTGHVLFDTHQNGEHLALMERALERMPANIMDGAHEEGATYFRSDRRLNVSSILTTAHSEARGALRALPYPHVPCVVR
eukprot:TRINITY_DN3535_c0_g1_i1.p1 TRINITY_DN3535_c0_g1~~TRINITY_DN3535_c0_g1_i1.p1  ORF type:complete len:371 (-),score=71.88 TRINITY_DN3535_c0_g1_i1:184-1296(-)